MKETTLRKLSKEYYRNFIDKDDYRKARRELIKDIVSGEKIVKPINYKAPLEMPNEDITTTKIVVEKRPEPETIKQKINITKVVLLILGVNILLIIAFIILLYN